MPIDADDLSPRKKPAQDIVPGQDLSALSMHELEARIAELDDEIVRCREEIKARGSTKAAADAFFRKP